MCQSQPNPGPLKTPYQWIILFDWDIDNPNPFMIDLSENFRECIPESWFRNKWKPQHRLQKTKMQVYPDHILSVCCKIEKGQFKLCSNCIII